MQQQQQAPTDLLVALLAGYYTLQVRCYCQGRHVSVVMWYNGYVTARCCDSNVIYVLSVYMDVAVVTAVSGFQDASKCIRAECCIMYTSGSLCCCLYSALHQCFPTRTHCMSAAWLSAVPNFHGCVHGVDCMRSCGRNTSPA